ncbi:hypothetical protein P9E09_07070 [Bacillus mojavensis]|uniref:hypothetical protein n=1 Tax=Bacillus mojavensis TaxID=72360 RepID=UPI002DB959E1|nr:hypothetical protein [Bacillus mojavensis]MEC1707414.1 hypothetical protein [Bacillus mojavensis]
MTLNDFMKRVSEGDKNKMIIYKEGGGWTNVNVRVTEDTIIITPDMNEIFSSDR